MNFSVSVISMLLISCVAFGQQAKPLTVTLSSDSGEIFVGSPLLTKIVLSNNGSDVVSVSTRPLGERYGTIRVEIKKPDSKEYLRIVTQDTGKSDSMFYQGDKYLPGEQFVEYVLLALNNNNDYIFDKAGAYKIRSVVHLGKTTIVSDDMTIHVQPRDKTSAKIHNERGTTLKKCLSITSCPAMQDIDIAMTEHPKDFENILRFTKAFTSIFDRNPEMTKKGEIELNKIAGSDIRLWNELSRLVLAEHFARNNKIKEAKDLLSETKERSANYDAVRKFIEQAKIEDGRQIENEERTK